MNLEEDFTAKNQKFNRESVASESMQNMVSDSVLPNNNLKSIECEIEARLRLQLKKEYWQRYHCIQDRYDQEMMKLIKFRPSFSHTLFGSQNYSIDNDISYQRHILQEENNFKSKNSEILQKVENELAELLNVQEKLKNEQKELSEKISAANNNNSALLYDLNLLRIKKNHDISHSNR